jgi:hypothetical protein
MMLHITVFSVYNALPLSIDGIPNCGTLTSEPQRRGSLVSHMSHWRCTLCWPELVQFHLPWHQWNMRAHWSVLRFVWMTLLFVSEWNSQLINLYSLVFDQNIIYIYCILLPVFNLWGCSYSAWVLNYAQEHRKVHKLMFKFKTVTSNDNIYSVYVMWEDQVMILMTSRHFQSKTY